MDVYFYLLLIEDDTNPDVQGPFVSADERNEAAREYRAEGFDGGIYPFDSTDDEFEGRLRDALQKAEGTNSPYRAITYWAKRREL